MMIANVKTGQLLSLKRVAFKRFTQKNLVVPLPDDFVEERYLKVYLMCDSYIGLDQEYTIDLIKVNQIIMSKAVQAAKSQKKDSAPSDADSGKQTGIVIDVKPLAINTADPKASKPLDASAFIDTCKDDGAQM